MSNTDDLYKDELMYDPDADEVITDPQPIEQTDKTPSSSEITTETEEEAIAQQETKQTETTNQLPKTVPYQRLQQKVHEANELKEKYRELELELARLQGVASVSQTQPAAQPMPKEADIDIDKLHRDHYEALLEGEEETALAIQKQINAWQDKQIELKAQQVAERIINEREQAKLQQQEQVTQAENQKHIDEFMDKYDYLNDESANFDPQALEVFKALFKTSVESGTMNFKQSLDHAANLVETFTNRQPTNKVTPKKTNLTEKQIEEQLKRVDKVPPQISKKGTTGNDLIIDPTNMSEEEYEQFRDKGGKFDFES